MAKDKPGKKVSMKDLIHEESKKNNTSGKEPNMQIVEDDIRVDEVNEDTNKQLRHYNSKGIFDIHPRYEKLVPITDVLVRVFTKPMERNERGILMPNSAPVQANTRSGPGIVGTMNNPLPYVKKAVVVAAPEESDYSKNDIVILKDYPVFGVAMGQGEDATLRVPQGFVHPEEEHKYMMTAGIPMNPEDDNYGYLLVRPHEIIFKDGTAEDLK